MLVTGSLLVGLVVLLIAAGVRIGSRPLTVKLELERAKALVGTLNSQDTVMDFVGVGITPTVLSAATS